ncbi:MAG: UV DNA damage repair endonuclease UvsE [Kiritimatiellia bacterium]
MIRFGLCCLFYEEPIKFRTATAKYSGSLKPLERVKKISGLCLENADSLKNAILFCSAASIGSFRINSRILPLKTHPELGYEVTSLPDGDEIIRRFKNCGKLAAENNIRLSFHPDQFTLLSSPDPEITRKSVEELAYQAEVAEWTGADVINIHGGGAYGNKQLAVKRTARNIRSLDQSIRDKLTLENDDRVYSPADLLPLCLETETPFVYDIHHHRCLPDGLTVKEVTKTALGTWNREALFHISSPKNGWHNPGAHKHNDYIDIKDFPECWKNLNITVDIEAKAKELAVIRLRNELKKTVSDKH